MSEIKAGIVLKYVAIVLRLATTFFLTPFIISSLGVEEYGIFMLSHSIIAWLTISDLGLGATVYKYVTTYRAKGEIEKQAHFLGQSIILYCLIALITLFAGLFCFFNLEALFPKLNASQLETLEILALLTLGNLILAIPMRPIGCIPSAYQKFVIPGFVGLCCSLLNTGLTISLLLLGFKAIALTILAVLMSILNLSWELYYTLSTLKTRVVFRKPDWSLYQELFKFSIWVFLIQIMDLLYWKAGSPILAHTCGAVAVSIYALGVSFPNYFMTASLAISNVLAPKLMSMVALDASKEELTKVMIQAGRLQTFILSIILLGFAFIGEDFLRLWVGKSFGEDVFTVWLGAIMVIVPFAIHLTQNTGMAILQALNIHRGRAIILFYSSLVCVVLGYVLSIYLGPIGMFAGTSISLIFGQVIMDNLYYKNKAGLLIGSFFRHTYQPLLLPVSLLVAVGFFLSNFWQIEKWEDLLISAGAYSIVLIATMFILYLNKAERAMFIAPIKRLLRIS